jgi:ubiquinone/menaquinone biosynthesis C-methylase UbiE
MTKLGVRVEIPAEKPLLYNQQERVNLYFVGESAYWREIYQQRDVFAAVYQLRRSIALNWIDALGLPSGSRVLEIGCGAGLMTLALAKRRFIVTAMDAVRPMLDETRHLAFRAGVGGRIKTALGDVHQLALRDSTFSLVIALGVIPWLHSPGGALREMARVIEPGGSLIVSADNRWRLNYCLDPCRFPSLMPTRHRVRRALEQRGRWKGFPGRTCSQAHSIQEFDALLAGAKLENEKQKTFGFGPFTFLNFPVLPNSAGINVHRWLQSLADHQFPVIRSTGCQYLVLARKGTSKS